MFGFAVNKNRRRHRRVPHLVIMGLEILSPSRVASATPASMKTSIEKAWTKRLTGKLSSRSAKAIIREYEATIAKNEPCSVSDWYTDRVGAAVCSTTDVERAVVCASASVSQTYALARAASAFAWLALVVVATFISRAVVVVKDLSSRVVRVVRHFLAGLGLAARLSNGLYTASLAAFATAFIVAAVVVEAASRARAIVAARAAPTVARARLFLAARAEPTLKQYAPAAAEFFFPISPKKSDEAVVDVDDVEASLPPTDSRAKKNDMAPPATPLAR